MEILWIVNALVALFSFLLWRSTPAIMEVKSASAFEDNKEEINSIFTVALTIICTFVLSGVFSLVVCYALVTIFDITLHSFSNWAVYLPHGIVCAGFLLRTGRAGSKKWSWKY